MRQNVTISINKDELEKIILERIKQNVKDVPNDITIRFVDNKDGYDNDEFVSVDRVHITYDIIYQNTGK
jgi:hypothetical protein